MPSFTIYPPSHPLSANKHDVLGADPSTPNGTSFGPLMQDAALTPASGVWVPLVNAPLSAAGLVTTTINGWEMAVPFYVPKRTTFKAFELDVTAAGTAGTAVLRIGIRANNAGIPGALLVDAGTVSGQATGMQPTAALGTPLTLEAGWYFYTVTPQGAPTVGATVRTMTTGDQRFPIYPPAAPATGINYWGYVQTGVTGALPATFAVTGTAVSAPVRFFAQGN